MLIKIFLVNQESLSQFGFSFSKVSSLCANGGSFLYPGEEYPVFLADKSCIKKEEDSISKQDIDLSQPIGELFIRSEFTPTQQQNEKAEVPEDQYQYFLFTELKQQLKSLQFENNSLEEQHSKQMNKCVEYEAYIRQMTQEYNQSISMSNTMSCHISQYKVLDDQVLGFDPDNQLGNSKL